MAQTSFKTRLKAAVARLVADHQLLHVPYSAVYTPMRINGAWTWMAFSEPDGILACKLGVQKGEPARPDECSEVLACVFVESEEATSDSLLNPWGKSCLPSVPNGVWIDIKDGGKRQRRLLSVAHVLFVTPEPSSRARSAQRKFKKRKGILERVDAAAPNASLLVAPKGESCADLATRMWGTVEQLLA